MPIHFKAPARLDAESITSMRHEFEQLAASGDDVVIDMARTETIDGSGVGAMVFAFKRLSLQGKRLSIRNVSGQPLDLLNDAGLLRTLAGDHRRSRLQTVVRSLRMAVPFATRARASVAEGMRAVRTEQVVATTAQGGTRIERAKGAA